MKKKILRISIVGMFFIVLGVLAPNAQSTNRGLRSDLTKLIVPCRKAFDQKCIYKDDQDDEHTLTEARKDD